jgi:hypothetical protein
VEGGDEAAAHDPIPGTPRAKGPSGHPSITPDTNGPNFDVAFRITDTEMPAMNDLFYSELAIKDGQITAYVKPLFRDMKVYDQRQDREKTLFRKLYEKLVGGVARLLENRSRQEVATVTPITGTTANPKASTWEIVVNLFENAFFKAILPGFEEEVRRLSH